MDRRSILQGIALAPLAKLVGCSSPASQAVDADTTDVDLVGGDDCGPAASAWASGGTIAMTAKDCYPDPFTSITPCGIACSTTAGPCTAPTTDRRDVSEAMLGLPARLALKIVTADTCTPLAGAVVEIWHTQRSGVYSGATPSPGFCSGDDAEAPSKTYFRGTQTTDSDGRVDFDTCFPGWYPGRCIHIHVSVKLGPTTYVVTQLFFPDELNRSIFQSHPDYVAYGQPDTSNVSDGIFGGTANADRYIVDVARMSDGAMLASKVIGVLASGPGCAV
jgi:protocatechuate 3,4-dioxygenase beta subunit